MFMTIIMQSICLFCGTTPILKRDDHKVNNPNEQGEDERDQETTIIKIVNSTQSRRLIKSVTRYTTG